MFDIWDMFHVALWPVILLGLLLLLSMAAIAIIVHFFGKPEVVEESDHYEKKPFVFDAMSELTLYRLLIDIFGDRYYIFPQVVYSRLVQLKKGESLRYRTHFDKKIADFVLCAKENAKARLVIELDGSSHQSERAIVRDGKVDKMMEQIGLPILHLKTDNFDREYIKGEVEKGFNH